MTKINVRDDTSINPKVTKKVIYYNLIEILQGLKLLGGNVFLNKTIHNHPVIKEFMLEVLKDDILELEREILKIKDS